MNESPLKITLSSGQTAILHSHDGKQTVIRSPESAPPGATVRGTLPGVQSEFQLKVRDCRKEGEEFVILGRTQNATKELLARLDYSGLAGNDSTP
jgi:hypothetical protein